MMRLTFKVYVSFLTICIAKSSIIHETTDNELNEKVRNIIENILQEKQMTIGGEQSGRNVDMKVEYLENKFKEMESKLVEQEKTIASLKNVIKKMEQEKEKDIIIKDSNGSKRNSSNIVVEEEDTRDVDVSQLIAPERRAKRATTNIAFSAYLTHTNSHTVIGQPIKFDRVLINDGQGYNNYTGSFTAPVAGVYLFTFSIDSGKTTFVKLVVNGVNQVDVIANPHTNVADKRLSHSMGGNTAIVRVAQGDAVLVETYETADGQVSSSDTFRLCTFSGVLLY